MNRVLTDGYPVVVIEFLLLHRFSIDESSVGAAKVHDPELLPTSLDARVMSAGRRVAKNQVVVRRPAHAKGGLGGAIGVASVGP